MHFNIPPGSTKTAVRLGDGKTSPLNDNNFSDGLHVEAGVYKKQQPAALMKHCSERLLWSLGQNRMKLLQNEGSILDGRVKLHICELSVLWFGFGIISSHFYRYKMRSKNIILSTSHLLIDLCGTVEIFRCSQLDRDMCLKWSGKPNYAVWHGSKCLISWA